LDANVVYRETGTIPVTDCCSDVVGYNKTATDNHQFGHRQNVVGSIVLLTYRSPLPNNLLRYLRWSRLKH